MSKEATYKYSERYIQQKPLREPTSEEASKVVSKLQKFILFTLEMK